MPTFREVSPMDLEALMKYANNYNGHLYTPNKSTYPYLKEHSESLINFATISPVAYVLAIDINREFLDMCGIRLADGLQGNNAELGIWSSKPFF